MPGQRLPSRIGDQVVNHDLPFERRGHAAGADFRNHWHILNGPGVARGDAGTGAKVKLCIGVDQKDRAMSSASCCLGDVAERVENVSKRLASRDHLEQTPLAGEKRLREFQVVDGDRLHCASLTMRLVVRSANHTLVSESRRLGEASGNAAALWERDQILISAALARICAY